MKVCSQWLGAKAYLDVLSLQEQKVSQLLEHKTQTAYVLAGSHQPVLSLGLRSQESTDLIDKKKLIENQFTFVRAQRGGASTLHMPGQLFIYPILNLKTAGIDLKDWVCFLKTSFQELIKKKYKLNLENKKDGLYFKDKKILFIGLRIKKGISYHGLALNVNNNLEAFSWIKTCGQNHLQFTSLRQELQIDCNLKEIYITWLSYLNHFIINL